MDDSCVVCAENLDWVAYGSCGHREVCSTCVVRLRFVLDNPRCCICKTESHVVFVTKALGDYTKTINDFSTFPSLPKEGRVGGFWYHEDSQAFFDDLDQYRMIKAMCRRSCSVLNKTEDQPREGGFSENSNRYIDDTDPLIQSMESLSTTDMEPSSRYLQAVGGSRRVESAFPSLSGQLRSEQNLDSLPTDTMVGRLPRQTATVVNSAASPSQAWTAVTQLSAQTSKASASGNSSFGWPATDHTPVQTTVSSSQSISLSRVSHPRSLSSVVPQAAHNASKIPHSSSAPNLSDTRSPEPSHSNFSSAVVQNHKTSSTVTHGSSNTQPPQDVQPANKSLIEKMRSTLGHDEELFNAFKNVSGQYRQGPIDVRTYLDGEEVSLGAKSVTATGEIFMGEHESWTNSPPSPSGLFPNGLLPGKAASVTRPLDAERWAKAEDRTAKLIACIQPNPPSEDRRNSVARYVRRLIMECFPRQVEIFTFGSVPLKTYLPDGDIDLTAFSTNQNLKDSWANMVRDMLEKEEKNENAEFHVKEVQYIQAEVKIIKCLVENIVVDISFNQIGGLCTLCFLEEVDHYISQNHLFKRSIILIKAWCYYESRILGAHHGLISTYALETLVLYIFHVFNNSFHGPLEVLYRFLEFFSKFDWQNFCISLWGPVPVNSLPDVTAESPRKDVGELRVSEAFLKACSRVYAVNPAAQETLGQPFVSKHFNVIDPLRENNNIGRSVSKGNFFRIRSAFTLGAKKLARLLDCPKENLIHEVNQFFMNTWERHGSGHRPDAPRNDLWLSRLEDLEPYHQAENVINSLTSKRNQNSARLGGIQVACSRPSQQNNCGTEVISIGTHQTQPAQEISCNQNALNDKLQQTVKPEIMVNNFHGRHLFARTRSSPELTETYGEALLQSRHNRALEAGKRQTNSTRTDNIRKNNLESESLSSTANNYYDDLGSVSVNEDLSIAAGEQGMHQEEQDHVTEQGLNGHFPFPFNFSSDHLQFPITPSILASMGYGHRNLPGIVPSNLPQPNVASFQLQRHQIHGYELAQASGSDSTVSLAPFIIGHSTQQNEVDSSGYTFYPTGPPVPIVAMLPMYNYQAGGNAASDTMTSHLSVDEGVENHDPCKSFDSLRGLDQSEMVVSSQPTRVGSSVEPTEHRNNILNGDFISHWQNLQYGRSCQNSQYSPVLYPSPVVVPPAYLQSRLQWDGPGIPLAYTNGVNQLLTYGPRLVSVAPVQPVSTRPPNIYHRYGNETPRYRSGTGTYFPNPKISTREQRPTSGMRRGNYGHDRNEHYSDREGNWIKTRSSGRNHNNRNQTDNKPNSRQDRSDRHWGSSYRHESSSYSSHHSQNAPIRSNTSQDPPGNIAYGMYRFSPGMKQNSDVLNSQSPMMFYSYDHNSVYNSPTEHLEFGSRGPAGEPAQYLNDQNHLAGAAFDGASSHMSSAKDPSSPHFSK